MSSSAFCDTASCGLPAAGRDPPTRGPPAAEEAAAEAGGLQVELDPEYEQWLWESREAG